MATSLPHSIASSSPGQSHAAHDRRGAHVVQLYKDDEALLDMLCRFICGALAVGDAGVVIATQAHHDGLTPRLKARGVDIADAIRRGRFIPVSAEDTMARVMRDGKVDETRFQEIIGDALTRARTAAGNKDSCIAVFGELVALLWAAGKQEQAIRIEQLWNELAPAHKFSLLCAYPMSGFDGDRQVEPFLRMCAQHFGVIPSESYMAVTTAEERLRTIAELQQKTQELQHALALRQSEERFRLLVDAVQDYAIFMLDTEGNVVSWNPGAQRIKGYLGAEIIGKHFSCFYPPDDLRNEKPQKELEMAARVGRFEDEGWRLRKDGTRFWASVIISAVRDDSGKLIGFAKVTRDFTERMETQEALRQEIAERRDTQRRLYDSEQSLRQLSRHLLRTQDEERRRIGRDLHDSLGQSLAALKINLDFLHTAAGVSRQTIDECIQLADSSIKEVRTISYLLYPPMLEEMGLKSAILWYLDGFSSRSGIQTTFDLRADFGRLHRDAEVALFRVLQESLTNIHRHSGSQTADIRLSTKNGAAILEIRDHGRGLAHEEAGQASETLGTPGVGLRSMQERVVQLGGRFEIDSTPHGTTITGEIPAQEFASSREKLA